MPKHKTIRLSYHEKPTEEMLQRGDTAVVKSFGVREVVYSKWQLDGKPPILKVSYFCYGAERPFKEFLCLEHTGLARTIAERWWALRSTIPVPATVDQALESVDALQSPELIHVVINKKYPEVVGCYGNLKSQSVRVVKG